MVLAAEGQPRQLLKFAFTQNNNTMKKQIPIIKTLLHAAVAVMATAGASPSNAAGHIDPSTVIAVPHGTFSGVQFTRYEAMFDGVSSQGRPYRVPCQIITPLNPRAGCRTIGSCPARSPLPWGRNRRMRATL